MKKVSSIFGDMVKKKREDMKLSQERLAEKANITAKTVQNIEEGKNLGHHWKTVIGLAEAFGINKTSQEFTEFRSAAYAKRDYNQIYPKRKPGKKVNITAQEKKEPVTSSVIFPTWQIPSRFKNLLVTAAVGMLAIILVVLATTPKINSTETQNCPHPDFSGVTIFEYPCFQGHFLTFTQTVLDLCYLPLDSSRPMLTQCFTEPSWNDNASSAWVSPGYKAKLYLNNPDPGDNLFVEIGCNSGIPDFKKFKFANGMSLDNNVSRIEIEKTQC